MKNPYSNDFDTSFRFFRTVFKFCFVLALLAGVGQLVVAGYVAVKYGPRALDAGTRLLEKAADSAN